MNKNLTENNFIILPHEMPSGSDHYIHVISANPFWQNHDEANQFLKDVLHGIKDRDKLIARRQHDAIELLKENQIVKEIKNLNLNEFTFFDLIGLVQNDTRFTQNHRVELIRKLENLAKILEIKLK